jgi:hypothetical protein
MFVMLPTTRCHLHTSYSMQKVYAPDTDASITSADLHEELLPLLRGAWLGKPSHASPRKRCFFQLSADGSTLRW